LHIVGIDPGIVDTGVVRLKFRPQICTLEVSYAVVSGIDAKRIGDWIRLEDEPALVFVEKYRPRSNFGTDQRMVEGERDLRVVLKDATFLNNTGIKAVVKPNILMSMGLWKFRLSTHHQDLRSAARIAVLGMMKDDQGNRVLSDFIVAQLDGDPWTVIDNGGAVV
jgi:hypothetical protein